MADVVSRRERVRVETTAEIKQRAWALMAEAGTDALSLREVARQMGMAPSALYRYFAGRNDLLSALIIDGYTGLAEALGTTFAASTGRGDTAVELWIAIATSYRRWAVEHPTEFALIYSTSIPDYQGTVETKAAAIRVSDVMLDGLERFLAEGGIDLERVGREIAGPYAEQLETWSRQSDRELPAAALAVAMRLWSALHGLVHLEMNSHFPPPLAHSEAQLQATMRALTDSVGPA